MVGTGRGAEAGILIRGGEALETAHKVDAVVLDKTGTLTLGRPVVDDVAAADGFDVREVIDLAASAEKGSEHPLAAAIIARARVDELGFRRIDGFATAVGGGVGRDRRRRGRAAGRARRQRALAARTGRGPRGARTTSPVGRRPTAGRSRSSSSTGGPPA